MREEKLTFDHVAKVWWLFIWRSIVIGVIAGLLVGGIAGGIAVGLMGQGDQAAHVGGLAGRVAGLVIWFPMTFWILRMALRNKYKGFRLAVIPTDPGDQS